MERQRKKTMKCFHILQDVFQGVFELMANLPIYRRKIGLLMSWMKSLNDTKIQHFSVNVSCNVAA